MSGYFLKADYPADIIQKGFSKAFHTPRHSLLQKGTWSSSTSDEKDEVFLITTYHLSGRILGDIVHSNWDMLDKSSGTREILEWKVDQGFERPKNIRDTLVRALVKNPMNVASLPPSHNSKAPLTQDHEVYMTVHEVGVFPLCRLRGGLCRLHDKTGTLPETSCSLRDKPCSLHVRAEIFWLFKNFHELHMKFDLDKHRVNLMLTSCTLRGILVDYWLTSCYFVLTSYPNSNTK